MGELPLEPEYLLIQGEKKSIKALRTKSDLLPMEWTTSEIQNKKYCKNFNFYFFKCCSPRSIRDTPTCCCFINWCCINDFI